MLLNYDVSVKFNSSDYISNRNKLVFENKVGKRFCASNISKNKKKLFMGAIGEYYERGCLAKDNENTIANDIYAYSLISNNVIKIDVEQIKYKHIFIDSCGMASHKNSKLCIKNATDEFIERQSFVYNYLSKSIGKLIPKNFIKKQFLKDNFFENINFYNISLINNYYVILAKGMINNKYYLGLGSSISIVEAINNCIKELYQVHQFNEEINKKNIKINLKEIEEPDYGHYYSLIDSNKVAEAYKYLDKSPEIEDINNLIYDKSISLNKILLNLYNAYYIEPFVTVFNSTMYKSNIKVIKIFDLNWFPSIFPYYFTQECYEFVENITGKKLDRNCTFIPFP